MPPAEKTTRQMIEGIPVPPVVGLLVNYLGLGLGLGLGV